MATKKGDKREPAAESEDDLGDDPVADMPELPLVQEIGWIVRSKPPAVAKKSSRTKAVVGFKLRPFTARPKTSMVTMSDLGMGGAARGNATPARNKKRD